MELFTIGFTQKPAQRFFGLLQEHRVNLLIDVRLHPGGQLAGFAKQGDLPYFLRALAGCDYQHLPLLAPVDEILSEYRKGHDWPTYARRFEALMDERRVPDVLDRQLFEMHRCCLLCSEATPEQCHRRLVAERLAQAWPSVKVVHLV